MNPSCLFTLIRLVGLLGVVALFTVVVTMKMTATDVAATPPVPVTTAQPLAASAADLPR